MILMFDSIRYASAVNSTVLIGMDQCFSSIDSFAFFPSDATYDTAIISLQPDPGRNV